MKEERRLRLPVNLLLFGLEGGYSVFMKLKILSWNVRGLNNPRKREVVKNLLRDWKGDVVCLQEIKLAAANLSIIRSIWGNMYVGWEVLNAVNSAGGIILMWDKRALEKIDCYIGTYSVSCQCKIIGYLESHTSLFDVDDLEGAQSSNF